MSSLPIEHVTDSLKLTADGMVELFELTPLAGGTLRFKNDNTVMWRGNEFTGLPVSFTDMVMTAQGSSTKPRMTIGEVNRDFSVFKPLVADGLLEGATVVYTRIKLEQMLANSLVRETRVFTIKRVSGYSRSQVSIEMATASDGLRFTIPHRQILPPAFPAVLIS
jgi:phage-related protein